MFASWNKLWIFYIIMAVGLVLAAKMMGKNSTKRVGEPGLKTYLLLPELDCHIRKSPCAAVFNDGALIARLYETKDQALLQVRQSGMTEQQMERAKFVVVVQGTVITAKLKRTEKGAYWSAVTPISVYQHANAIKLTVASDQRWMTDFEL